MKIFLKHIFGPALLSVVIATLIPRASAQGGVPLWTKRYNGPSNLSDEASAVAVDGSGNVIVTGVSVGITSGENYVTIKYSSVGGLLWTRFYNGPGNYHDNARAVAVDGSGNVFVTGYADGGFSDRDYGTIKYSAAGVALWTNLLDGATIDDEALALAVDDSGNVTVTGELFGGAALTYGTIKYSTTGTDLWFRAYSPPPFSDAFARDIAVDASGNVIVTGFWPGGGSFYDYATIKYSSAGALLWTNHYNGTGNGDDAASALAVDGSGNVVVTGSSASTNNYPWDFDYATIKYSSEGAALWTNRYGGPVNGDDTASAVAVDCNGNVLVTGNSGNYPNQDYVTIKYSDLGVALWTNRYNGTGNGDDAGSALAVDRVGNVFVTGASTGSGGSYDYATIAYSSAGVALWTNRYNGTGNGEDRATALAVDGSGNVFVTGYSTGSGSSHDIVTIKYSSSLLPVHLTIERDGSGGFFIRYTGAPDVSYRLQRAASVTGTWSNLSTNTAPASGLIEFHDTSPLPGQAFYRTVQP